MQMPYIKQVGSHGPKVKSASLAPATTWARRQMQRWGVPSTHPHIHRNLRLLLRRHSCQLRLSAQGAIQATAITAGLFFPSRF